MDVSVNEYAVSEEETRTSEAMSFEEAVRAYGDAVTRACLVLEWYGSADRSFKQSKGPGTVGFRGFFMTESLIY